MNSTISKVLKNVASVVLCTSVIACAPSKEQGGSVSFNADHGNNIVYGTAVDSKDRLAHQVLRLYLSYEGKTLDAECTATAITKRVILTAAHCFFNSGKEVADAAIEVPGTKELIRVKKRKIEEGYKYFGKKGYLTSDEIRLANVHDMALGFLDKDLPNSIEITKLYDGVSSFDQDAVVIAGYGLTESEEDDGAGSLHKGFGASAHDSLEYAVLFDVNFTLSAGSPSHACSGDSGGPAFVVTEGGKLQQIGIDVSGSHDCRGINIYVSTYAYKDVIRDFLAKIKKEGVK